MTNHSRAEAQAAIDSKTKPRGSLGRLEALAVQIAEIRGTANPGPLPMTIVLAAADHGYADAGTSAYPAEVTLQMVHNYVAGGAAVCVLARQAGAALLVVDAGVREPVSHPSVLDRRIGPGTANATLGPAMTREQAELALAVGVEIAAGLDGIVCLGEMGIGNSTTAAALTAALTGADPQVVCGRGTGIDDAGLARKVAAVRRALAVNAPDPNDPIAILAAVGGFEIGVLAGVAIGAARNRCPVLLDGFITTSAALIAARIEPASIDAMIAAHRSPEPGHQILLDELGLTPLLDLGLRLGEGSGAALALPILSASLAILDEMASFADAGVTDTGR